MYVVLLMKSMRKYILHDYMKIHFTKYTWGFLMGRSWDKKRGNELYVMNMPQSIMSGFMCYYEYYAGLYDVCEKYCVYMSQCLWSLLKLHVAWFQKNVLFKFTLHGCHNKCILLLMPFILILLKQSVGVDF